MVKLGSGKVDTNDVELERCPYDQSPIAVAHLDESVVITCAACGAVWEMQGTAIRRRKGPDPDTMKAVREGLFPIAVVRGRRAMTRAHDAAR